MLNTFFNQIYAINRDSRTDRLEMFQRQADQYRFTFKRMSAIEPTYADADKLVSNNDDRCRHYKLGCTLSHMACIQDAKENNFERVLIFEDDALFLPEFSQVSDYLLALEGMDWDIAYLGGSPDLQFPFTNIGDYNQLNDYWYSAVTIWGAHAYGIQRKFYDRLLEPHMKTIFPFDYNLLYVPKETRKYVISKELLVTQSDTYSDLQGDIVKRTDIYRENYKKALT